MLKDFYLNLAKQGYKSSKQQIYTKNLSLFEEIVAAFLAQNTKWDKVLKSLQNLQTSAINENNILSSDLATLIKPSGFYNTKAKKITEFFTAINKDFLQDGISLQAALNSISKEYLLRIKGISELSADELLCIVLCKEILPINSAFVSIAAYLGYEIEYYSSLQEIFMDGIYDGSSELLSAYGACSLGELMCMIYFSVGEFYKQNHHKKDFLPQAKELLNTAL